MNPNPIIEILRLADSSYGTFGVLKFNKMPFCVTLEPPDMLNRQNLSSIPAKQYTCNRVESVRFGSTFEVQQVPDRTHILFHPGNTVTDTSGCILLAQHFGKLYGNRAVLNSGNTFHEFMQLLNGVDTFHLTLTEHY